MASSRSRLTTDPSFSEHVVGIVDDITSPTIHVTVAATLEIQQRDGLMLMKKKEKSLKREIEGIEI